MTRDEYFDQLVMVGHVTQLLMAMAPALGEMAEMIQHADSIGIMLDPTAWIKGEKAMHEDEQVIQILRHAAVELRKLPWPEPVVRAGGAA